MKSLESKNLKSLGEIYSFLDALSPFVLQEEWDNSGLIVGDFDTKINDIVLCLEVTKQIAMDSREDSLIISHHPLIFKGLKKLDFREYPSNIIRILIKKNISLISMHTNFDTTHLNEYFVKHILGFNDFKKEGIACTIEQNLTFKELTHIIKTKMNNAILKISQINNRANKIGIICGSGISEIDRLSLDVDCVITGDVKYHDAMRFQSLGINIIDVGHYDSECFFGAILSPYLKKIHYNAIILDSQNPFSFH